MFFPTKWANMACRDSLSSKRQIRWLSLCATELMQINAKRPAIAKFFDPGEARHENG